MASVGDSRDHIPVESRDIATAPGVEREFDHVRPLGQKVANRTPRLVRSGDFAGRARNDVPSKVEGQRITQNLCRMAAGNGENRTRSVNLRPQEFALRHALALTKDRGAHAAKIENRRHAGVKKGCEVRVNVGQRHLPRGIGCRRGMRVNVDQPGKQGFTAAIDFEHPGSRQSGWSDSLDAAVFHHHVAQALEKSGVGRVKYTDVAEDQRS